MGFLIPRFVDIVDILVIAFVIYQALLIVRRTGAHQVLWGLLFLFVSYFLAVILDLKMVTTLLSAVRNFWILAIV
ncbi:MAG TPA: TIGR00159 family protein, partial [Candidatus Cloacimonadota bacterium]|nr:TIGR00159 family protein [Candidatus Cloacimonadota bacterium]